MNDQRIAFLDGLRGIAALVVVLEHTMKLLYPVAFLETVIKTDAGAAWHWLSYPPFNLLHNGAWAVTVFFVLSGYVLALKAFNQKNVTPSGITLTIIGRYVRLALPVLASLCAVIVLMAVDAFRRDEVTLMTGMYESRVYEQSAGIVEMLKLAFIDSMFFGRFDYNPPIWTMTMELYGSIAIFLLAPLLLLIKKSPASPWVAALVYAGLIILLHHTLLLGFALGMLLAHLTTNPQVHARLDQYKQYWVPVAFVAGIYLCGYMVRGLYDGLYVSVTALTTGRFVAFEEYLFNTWGAALLMTGILYCKTAQRWLESDVLLKLGAISFSLYLTHYIVLASFSSRVYLAMQDHGHAVAAAVTVAASMPIIFIVATAFHYASNVPAERLSRRIRHFKGVGPGTRIPQASAEPDTAAQ